MFSLILALSAAASPDCPSRTGTTVLSSATARLQPGKPLSAVCVFGSADADEFWTREIIVIHPNHREERLVIRRDRSQDMPLRHRPRITIEDLNFDGAQDVPVQSLAAPSGNSAENVWIFDATHSRFVFNAVLSRGGHIQLD